MNELDVDPKEFPGPDLTSRSSFRKPISTKFTVYVVGIVVWYAILTLTLVQWLP